MFGCEFSLVEQEQEQEQEQGQEQGQEGIPRCPECGAMMRPGVVWFGEQLDLGQTERVENFLRKGACDLVLVIGTTALFGYIIDWALRAAGKTGQLIEINPDETPLSQIATEHIRDPAAVALPPLVNELLGIRGETPKVRAGLALARETRALPGNPGRG
jgi:NAD-dependent SIR2 family protein deacetylase